ncbi:MAG TPA: alpha/beta fold hydrolase [Polyangiaceae bacterium]|nr:alpha/beta fold hydrolase [Polyangiaceae bacterium]
METFKARDGIQIGYFLFGSRGAPPPVILHHGFGASAELNWVLPGVVGALTAAGRWGVAVDARGHGRSEKPHDSALYGEGTMGRDLTDVVSRLEVSEYDLVGYSMGAVVSLLVAVRDPRVRRLVIGGVGAGVVQHGGVDRTALRPESVIAALETPDPTSVTEPLAREFRMLADSTGADRMALAAQARAMHGEEIPLARIASPTLVIAGDEDPLATRPELLTSAIPGARLQRVHGDHVSCLFDPRFRESLTSFLS